MDLEITIIEKLRGLLSTILSLKKEISLFAVIKRKDTDTWDLVIGGNDLRTKENLRLIIRIMRKQFDKNEILKFPRLILLNSNHPFLDSINKAFSMEGGLAEIIDTKIYNVFIKNAYLLYSKSIKSYKKKDKYEIGEKKSFSASTRTSSSQTTSENIDVVDNY